MIWFTAGHGWRKSYAHKTKWLLQFVAFLERLSRTLNMDELTQDIGIELHTDSIIHRAEQLARLESDKIVDKVSRYVCIVGASTPNATSIFV